MIESAFTHFSLEPFWVKIRQGRARIRIGRKLVLPGSEHMLMEFDRKNVAANAVAPRFVVAQTNFYPF